MAKKVFKVIGIVLGAIVILVAAFVLVLTVTEFKPADTEEVDITKAESETVQVQTGTELTVMTWNVGYCALGENADYFMDGGSMVNTATAEEVEENIQAVQSEIEKVAPDVLFLQETDRDSKRSHYIDEEAELESLNTDKNCSFAYNYKTLYVPYPFPSTIGKVECGVMTMTGLDVSDAYRVSLPCPFTYPLRLCNLKRCLLIDRIPVEGTDKELVLINLHLEAYDSGEGKAKQTAQLRELIESEIAKGNYVIAGGDFNQTFSTVDMSAFPLISEDMWTPSLVETSDFDSSLQFIMDNDTPSCRSLDKVYAGTDKSQVQYYCIDGFIVSGNIEIKDYGIDNLDFKNSDHNPLVMNIVLK